MNGKKRTTIPKRIQELVMDEFNHRCAVCGGDKPQLHHIDENPSNHEELNLIPLCPNCHLIDTHHPTRPIPASILKLFREYRDPSILTPEFVPLHSRFEAVMDFSRSYREGVYLTADLIRFVRALKMGEYYAQSIKDFTTFSSPDHGRFTNPENHLYDQEAHNKAIAGARIAVLEENGKLIENRLIELLRYQGWEFKSPGRKSN